MNTITLPRATVEQALEALKDDQYRLVEVSPNQYEYKTDLAIAALQRALAQRAEPVEQMPVGWLESPHGAFRADPLYKMQFPSQLLQWQIALYTAPPQRKPLTDQEIDAVWDQWFGAYGLRGPGGPYTRRGFARAIERAHGITDPQIEDSLARHGIPMPDEP